MQAVIVDLDKTLLRTDKTISAYTLDILQRCRRQGISIMAATARPERSILIYHKQICFDAIATMNGARVILPDRVLENGIPHRSGMEILSKLIAMPDALISVETSDGIYSNAEIPEWGSSCYDGFPDLPTQGTLYKILVSGISYSHMERVLTEDVYHTIANDDLVQIMSKDATKWRGIQAMLGALDIPHTEAVYFGDDNDDIEPIRRCGIGVAVSNAIEAVRDAADRITGSNDEDGVAHYIETDLLA